jgi:hypothetical protein
MVSFQSAPTAEALNAIYAAKPILEKIYRLRQAMLILGIE